MIESTAPRWPRLYEHTFVLATFSVGAIAAVFVSGEWRAATGSGWCFAAIAWFPSVILEFFRRTKIESALFSAALLSGIAGFDGFLRLVRQTVSGC